MDILILAIVLLLGKLMLIRAKAKPKKRKVKRTLTAQIFGLPFACWLSDQQ